MSIEFKWNTEHFDALMSTCMMDGATPYILKYMQREGKIIEAGCGLARYVAYLSELGYDIEGVELSDTAVDAIRKLRPLLKVRQGDITRMEYPDDSVSGVISLGVVEHFIGGPAIPLKEMRRILKPNYFGVITVPSLNYIRILKYKSGYYFLKESVKSINTVRKLLKKKPLSKKDTLIKNQYKYATYLTGGDFFEYRFTKKEFENELIKAGFTIIESVPISQVDGLYHDFGRFFVSFKNWKFKIHFLGKLVNYFLSKMPFCHNHMHLCVVRK